MARLGRFFLEADRAARDRGVFLSFRPLHGLVAVNRENRDSWRPLIPIFDGDKGGFKPETGYVIKCGAGRVCLAFRRRRSPKAGADWRQ
jgi:hypothetical protein